jgi:hypothetical protein
MAEGPASAGIASGTISGSPAGCEPAPSPPPEHHAQRDQEQHHRAGQLQRQVAEVHLAQKAFAEEHEDQQQAEGDRHLAQDHPGPARRRRRAAHSRRSGCCRRIGDQQQQDVAEVKV